MPRRPTSGRLILLVAALAAVPNVPSFPAPPDPHLPPVRVAYFVPGDRGPIDGYRDRLDRVMTEVQRFYRDGMAAAGFGPMTFRLDCGEDGRLRVLLVSGRHPSSFYGRDASAAVRREVKASLAERGIDVDRGTLVIFQVLLKWEDGKAIEVGPYCGGGSHLGGTAWVYDDALLDPGKLDSKEPGGYYHRPCSVGEFNSHYIGGVAHELGHAFGLPHVRQRDADRDRGTALMGAGNHTYGRDQRGEGPGTFLTRASALLLARSRPFAGDLDGARGKPSCRLEELDASSEPGELLLSGRLAAEPPVVAIAAYNDRVDVRGDYDAVGWTCDVGDDGRFRIEIGEIRPGDHQLRLRPCHSSGATSLLSFDYHVGVDGLPKTDVFVYGPLLEQAIAAYATGNRERARLLAAEIQKRCPESEDACRKARHLDALTNPASPKPLEDVPPPQRSVLLAELEFAEASVGWRRPLRNHVLCERPGECFIQVDGRFFESGLYAHAPARHVFALDGQWKRLRTGFGLQDGHSGTAVFVIRGDGRELFRSPKVSDRRFRETTLDVSDVVRLELVVEDAGDGNGSDWGVWIAPELER